MAKSFVENNTYDDLRSVTRYQLLKYPEANIKMQVKSLIKSFIFDGNSIRVDRFSWPNGLLATSLEWSHRASGDDFDVDYLKQYYDTWISKGSSIQYIDHIINGYSLIYLYQLTNEKKYKNLLDSLLQFLIEYPKTNDGSFPYRRGNQGIVLVDGIGMVCPFLCRYGSTFNNKSAIDIAVTQILNFISKGLDNMCYIPYHGYETTNNKKVGIIGWGRGVGWLLIGMVDSLEYIPKSNPSYKRIVDYYIKVIESVIKFQNKEGYFTWQVTALDGYSDTSSTSMIIYAIKRGIMIGVLDKSYMKYVNLALNSLYNSTRNGLVLDCSAECKGISMYPQIYGAYPWAQGPTTALAALSIEP